MLVLHYTGMPTGELALERLCNPNAEVSCHYLIWEDGSIDQLVPEARRAWHAGKSHWAGVSDLNSASIGIELVNPGHDPIPPIFPQNQIAATIALCRDILSRHKIPAARILAHSDIAPGRKIDPGETFPWPDLFAAGIGHWHAPEPLTSERFFSRSEVSPPIAALQSMLALYGYGIEINGIVDERTEAVIAAFQRHFRPARVDGVADASTITTLKNLIVGL